MATTRQDRARSLHRGAASMSRRSLRRYARRDSNEAEIVKAVKSCGASWLPIAVRDGPDGIVGFRGQTHLVEIKTAKGAHKPGQVTFSDSWRGAPIIVVRSAADVFVMLGIRIDT